MIVKEASYEVSEPTVDSQVVELQGSGANVFLIAASPKFAAQAIRKSFDLGWNAARYLSNVSLSIVTVLKPAGLEKSKGLISGQYIKDVNDQRWKEDAGVKDFRPSSPSTCRRAEFADINAAYGFSAAAAMVGRF